MSDNQLEMKPSQMQLHQLGQLPASEPQGPRTAIPLRSILNVDDEGGPAEAAPPQVKTESPLSTATVAENTIAQRSRFLFVNSHNASRPNARLREDQKVINAHVQHASHRQRRAAAIGRLRLDVRLCANCVGPDPPVQMPSTDSNPSASPSSSEGSSPSGMHTNILARRAFLRRGADSQHICRQCGVDLPVRGAKDGRAAVSSTAHTNPRRINENILWANAPPPFSFHPSQQSSSILGAGVIDPFGTGSVSLTMNMNGVMRHFLEVIIPSLYPIQSKAKIQCDWTVQLVLAEPQVLFAVLAISAADLQARTGHLEIGAEETAAYSEEDLLHKRVPSFVEYKVKAIKAFNEDTAVADRASDIPAIAVVMSIIFLEAMTGNQKEVRKYTHGLQQMLNFRGGFKGLPDMIVSSAMQNAYMMAAMTRSYPMEPPLLPLATAPSSTYNMIMSGVGPQLQEIGTGCLEPTKAPLFSQKLIQIFRDIREVILYREYFHERECVIPAIEIEYFTVEGYHTLFRALSLPFDHQELNLPQEEPCRIALIIFWHANYHIQQPNSAIFRSLTAQLKTGLEQSELKSLWHPHYDLLVWVTFVGACISVGKREHTWFIAYLARAAQKLYLKQSRDLKAVLMRFFYIDRLYHNKLEEIWDEVKILMDAI